MKKILFLLLTSVLLVVSCSEDADFSSSPDLRLEFSCDTLSFDTLFTTVGSPTGIMKVYNRNGSSLRIASVSLAGGGTSGFRINVDGQHSDYISDLEIRKNDSIYVFVEATLPENHGETPLVVTDSLVFTLESGVQQHVTLLAYGRDVVFMRGVVVHSDSTVSRGHYIVYDSLVVASDATLTIEAGTTLYFHSGVEMRVEGTLQAGDESGDMVVFRGDRTDNMFSYLPYDRIPGQWGGILFAASSTGNLLRRCDVHSAEYGVRVEAGDTASLRLSIESSRIENVHGNALETVRSRVRVHNSLLANAGGNCVKVVGGDVEFVHCTIANFYAWTVRDVALALHNSIEGEPASLSGALFANCVIAGSKDDEVMGYMNSFGDTIVNDFNYRFVSSFMNTIDDGDENFVGVVYDDENVHPYAKEHFRLIDHSIFSYDFHLSDSALARGMASDEYSVLCPFDLDGVQRPATAADAGCFQFVPGD